MIELNNTIKSILRLVGAVGCVGFLIAKADAVAFGVGGALELCVTRIFPSVFPFMVVSSYILKSGAISVLEHKIEKLSRFVFCLPARAGVIFIMSLVGGFPVGAKLISDSVKNHALTRNQGKRMLLFCVNPGPAFVINMIGVSLIGSYRAGVILFVSLCVASLTAGIVSRLFKSKEGEELLSPLSKDPYPLIDAVNESVESILRMCAWIVIFSAFLGVVDTLPVEEGGKEWLTMVAEVTKGCSTCVKKYPLPFMAFVLGWSGFSVHAQLMPYIAVSGLKYKHFAVARVFNATVSLGVAGILFKLFPCKVSVFSNLGEFVPHVVSISAPATVGLLFLSALVILDLAPKRKM